MYVFLKILNLQRQWWVAYIYICNLNTGGLSGSRSKTILCRDCMFQRKQRYSSEHFEELQWIFTDILTKDIQWAKHLCIKNWLNFFFWANFSFPQMSFFMLLLQFFSDIAQWIIVRIPVAWFESWFFLLFAGLPEVLHTLSKCSLIYRRGIMIACLGNEITYI